MKTKTEKKQNISKHKYHLNLVKSLKTGDVKAIQKCISESNITLCPLISAVYSLRSDVVKYIENQSKGNLLEQWKKCDIESVIAMLNNQKPDLLPDNPVYCDLGEWYYNHRNAIWCAHYDSELLSITHCEHWNNDLSFWEQRSLLDTIEPIQERRYKSIVDSDDKNTLLLPPLVAHKKAIAKVEENLSNMIKYLQQIKEQLSTLAKKCGPECSLFQSGDPACIINKDLQDIEELGSCCIQIGK